MAILQLRPQPTAKAVSAGQFLRDVECAAAVEPMVLGPLLLFCWDVVPQSDVMLYGISYQWIRHSVSPQDSGRG